MRMSQAAAIPKPPPKQTPRIEATVVPDRGEGGGIGSLVFARRGFVLP
jgi:hypothetical protein